MLGTLYDNSYLDYVDPYSRCKWPCSTQLARCLLRVQGSVSIEPALLAAVFPGTTPGMYEATKSPYHPIPGPYPDALLRQLPLHAEPSILGFKLLRVKRGGVAHGLPILCCPV